MQKNNNPPSNHLINSKCLASSVIGWYVGLLSFYRSGEILLFSSRERIKNRTVPILSARRKNPVEMKIAPDTRRITGSLSYSAVLIELSPLRVIRDKRLWRCSNSLLCVCFGLKPVFGIALLSFEKRFRARPPNRSGGRERERERARESKNKRHTPFILVYLFSKFHYDSREM